MLCCYDIILERGNFTSAFNLHVEAGQLLSLLGPSGAGKSSILHCIAGLISPKEGRIEFMGRDITHTPPQDRSACMVFQSYALFPHLSVADNIAYGLRMRKYTKDTIQKRVAGLMELLSISDLAEANIHDISGGEQQRVALARALAPEPDILLLDEPLAALDRQLRIKLRQEIRTIQRERKLTVVYVTHDQEEAFAISDSIALIHKGRVEQIGSPDELYNNPSNPFIASFLGECLLLDSIPRKPHSKDSDNSKNSNQFQTALGTIHTNTTTQKNADSLCIRPEDIVIDRAHAKWSDRNSFNGVVTDWQSFGSYAIIYLRAEKTIVPIHVGKHLKKAIGSTIEFSIPEDSITILSKSE